MNATLNHKIEYITPRQDGAYEIEGLTEVERNRGNIDHLYDWRIVFNEDLSEIILTPFIEASYLKDYEIAGYFLNNEKGFWSFDENKFKEDYLQSLKSYVKSKRLIILTTDTYKPKPPRYSVQIKLPMTDSWSKEAWATATSMSTVPQNAPLRGIKGTLTSNVNIELKDVKMSQESLKKLMGITDNENTGN